ncbi:histidine kinase [Clostridium carboxidivorans P7]|uniref:Signal transduction histidine kinase regulating citrate/malate metabolism n=1 Tax=Clostridium carboxidivorans P7 TaxID=536227 RepID=C6Q2V8_9CLOT|nr:GHKL domain-containing protein [Clostridium carboxidivorans]AKN31519.1 histidine kinase [Clostridium carboxidivorans P7]EET84174.1 signal transduction histidine kinase regulating citrate/malate metabolism [Clostridium carboxidivorans P7]EFG87081.1 membrane protein, putative [Clostridium carboxidivorans P7]
MNNYELFVVTFFEISSFMIIFSIFNKTQEKLIFKNLIVISITSISVVLTNVFFTNAGDFVNYIIVIILVAFIYDDKHNICEITLEFCISLVLIIILELFFTTILKLTPLIQVRYTFKNGITVDLFLVLSSLLIYYKLTFIEKYYSKYKSIIDQYTVKMLIFNSIIYIICFKLLWEYNKHLVLNYIIIFTLVFISSNIANFILANQIIKLTEEKKSVKLSSMYSGFVEEMISEIRRKQHEFKNHLNAIYGICYTIDEKHIKDNITNYVKSVNSSMIVVDRLIGIENKVVAAVIYSKVCEAQAKKIKFSYSVESKLDNIKLKEYELVEILSNLLNNAFEYVELNNVEETLVYVKVGIKENSNFIEVSNYYVPTSEIDISLMVKKGFSTKGKGRGYGVYNVKKLLENNGGKLQIYFKDKNIIFRALF